MFTVFRAPRGFSSASACRCTSLQIRLSVFVLFACALVVLCLPVLAEVEYVDAILLDSLDSVHSTPKKGTLLPGQSCPVVFTSTVTRTPAYNPAKSKATPAKRGRVGKKPKVGGKKRKGGKSLLQVQSSSFLEVDETQAPDVPPLTPEQIAQCAADREKFLAGKSAAPTAPATPAAPKGKGVGGQKFTSLVDGATNSQIWNPAISDKVKNAVADYLAKKRLPNGRVYGGSVREVSLTGKTAAQVEKALKKFQCVKENQLVKNVTTNQPIIGANGKTIPMITFVCPDGGAIRLKPEGESTSPFRPQPHGAKALRWPYNSSFNTFDDEVIKVDNTPRANPLPKWGKDLFVWFPNDKAAQFDATDAWADRAHANLKK